jgi:hypothetical protein
MVLLASLSHVLIITRLFLHTRGAVPAPTWYWRRNAFVNVGSDAQILKPLVQPSTTVASLLLTTSDPPDVGGTMQLLLRQVAHRVEYWMDTIEEEVGGYCGLSSISSRDVPALNNQQPTTNNQQPTTNNQHIASNSNNNNMPNTIYV